MRDALGFQANKKQGIECEKYWIKGERMGKGGKIESLSTSSAEHAMCLTTRLVSNNTACVLKRADHFA